MDGIGIHDRLKIDCRKASGFESRFPDQLTMIKQEALNIIQKYLGNIGNNPGVRKEQEDCAEELVTICETEFEIACTIKYGLTNPHNRQDLEEAKQKIYNDIIAYWDDYYGRNNN